MATNYERGRRIEYKVKELLEASGYYVIRSAGSNGVIDVIAIRNDILQSIQVKRTKTKPCPSDYKDEIENFKLWKQKYAPSNMECWFYVYQDKKGFVDIIPI